MVLPKICKFFFKDGLFRVELLVVPYPNVSQRGMTRWSSRCRCLCHRKDLLQFYLHTKYRKAYLTILEELLNFLKYFRHVGVI